MRSATRSQGCKNRIANAGAAEAVAEADHAAPVMLRVGLAGYHARQRNIEAPLEAPGPARDLE